MHFTACENGASVYTHLYPQQERFKAYLLNGVGSLNVMLMLQQCQELTFTLVDDSEVRD